MDAKTSSRLFKVGFGTCEPIREFERVTVTRIESLRGSGTERDPYRLVETWITDDGLVLTHLDAKSNQERSA